MPRYESEWATTSISRTESDVAEYSPDIHLSEVAEFCPDTGTSFPGGYLVWVSRKPTGETHIHGCRVHHTVECSILEAEDLTAKSQIDEYLPPTDMASNDGFFPFGPSVSVCVDSSKNPQIFCLSSRLEMFASDNFRTEAKSLNIGLYDRPSRVAVGRFRGQNVISACMKMRNGDVFFSKTTATAELSSSSSSISSASTASSQSSPSSNSSSSSPSSSSASTHMMTTSSWSSASTHMMTTSSWSSASTELLTTSSMSSVSRSTLSVSSESSLTSVSSPTSISSLSSMSGDCLGWDELQVIDETFYDMDGRFGGVGTVSTELLNWNIEGLYASNTDACDRLWCIYIPQGTYGVGGASVGMVYMYKKRTSRPNGPPYVNADFVGGFELDSSSKYGTGWPKTLTISNRGTGGPISGTVAWHGGLGHGTLAPNASAYRLQIPFSIRREISSTSSVSSPSSLTSNTEKTSASSDSSATICVANSPSYWAAALDSPQTYDYAHYADPIKMLQPSMGVIQRWEFFDSIKKSQFGNCSIRVVGKYSNSLAQIIQQQSPGSISFPYASYYTSHVTFEIYKNESTLWAKASSWVMAQSTQAPYPIIGASEGWVPMVSQTGWPYYVVVGRVYVTMPRMTPSNVIYIQAPYATFWFPTPTWNMHLSITQSAGGV